MNNIKQLTTMSSKNKKNKVRNAYVWGGALKEKHIRGPKGLLFYVSTIRQELKRQLRKEINNNE